MKSIFRKNCCDGVYNSFDVHFTSLCDNKCSHCIDIKYNGIDVKKPNVDLISKTIIENQNGYDDVLFLGGEPCLYLNELISCVKMLRKETKLKLYVTTSVPKICSTKYYLFEELLSIVDGVNLSVQHHNEDVADEIRRVKSKYDRQSFYNNLPYKDKIRINLNIVKPYLYKKDDIIECLTHYDKMGFNEIKLSEIQHGKEYFVSFEETFGIKLKPPYTYGCQTYINTDNIIPNMSTPLLLKRSCFMCEDTLKASFSDGIKTLYKILAPRIKSNFSVIYGDGTLKKGWV